MFYKFLFVFLIVGVVNASAVIVRLMKGKAAKKGEFPFAASLRHVPGFHSCGCTILNERWVLTAAHCVALYKNRPSTFKVQYGITITSDSDKSHLANVKKIVVHQEFDFDKNQKNDIAVLLLVETLIFNDKVKPVDLPKQFAEVPANSKATLVGWGYKTVEHGVIQDHLQKVNLITFSDRKCNKLYQGLTHKSQICAGVPKNVRSRCSADTGSPLIVDGFLVGIVSWANKPCNNPPHPGVYTKVSHFVNWIMQELIINHK